MDTIIIRTAYVAIQILFLAILIGTFYVMIKGNTWMRVLFFIAAIGIVGVLGFSMGMKANMRTDRHRFSSDFEHPHRLLMSHLLELLNQQRYDDAKDIIATLEDYRFHRSEDSESHTNFRDTVISILTKDSNK